MLTQSPIRTGTARTTADGPQQLRPNAMPIPTELLAKIAERLSPGGEPGNAVDAMRVWNSLYAKFSPLIGPLSTELLFVRTLSEHAADFPWLAQCAMPDSARDALGAFARCLENQAPADVVAANEVLLATYTTELADLIGERLAIQFLRAAFPARWDNEKT